MAEGSRLGAIAIGVSLGSADDELEGKTKPSLDTFDDLEVGSMIGRNSPEALQSAMEDHLSDLEHVHAEYANSLSEVFSYAIDKKVTVRLLSVHQSTFAQYVSSRADTSLIYRFGFFFLSPGDRYNLRTRRRL